MPQFGAIFDQIQTFFSGESEKVIVDSKGYCEVVRLREGTFDVSTLPANGLTEQDRLSYMVNCIDAHCAIVPVGSYKKTPLGEIHLNEAFKGLKFDDISCLESYMHLRPHR